MKKLFVAGCSFSDFTKVNKVYGQYLAEKLNYSYVHEGAGCGSNWRIWRVITNHILNGNLTENDLLIVQYTTFERTEFWTSLRQPDSAFIPEERDHITIEKCKHGGAISRFKSGSYEWQNTYKDKIFHKSYELYFLNTKFEEEKFKVHNEMFQHLLKNYNIKTIFLKTFRYWREEGGVIPYYQPYVFKEEDSESSKTLGLSDQDQAHLGDYGHRMYAEMLYKHIYKNRLL